MSTAPISVEDERRHPVLNPSPHWSDSMYFSTWDRDSRLLLIARLSLEPNIEDATAGLFAWRDGQAVFAYGHRARGVPTGEWDDLTVDRLSVRMVAPGQTWELQLHHDDARADLVWSGLSPATFYDAHPLGPLPTSVAWGHYQQTCRVSGSLTLHGERIEIDGVGQRDHSWGFRHWTRLHQWHWVTGFLDDGRAFNVCEVLRHDGRTAINGYVHLPDDDQYVVGFDRVLTRDADGGAAHCQLGLTTTDGSTFTLTGTRAGGSVPVRPADDQTVIVHETPIRLEGAGSQGHGIYAHLVTEFD